MTLTGLSVGALTLTPAFDPDVTEYTATTANDTDTITATPYNPTADVTIALDGTEIEDEAEWEEGENELTVTVEKGSRSNTYTVNVTYTPPEE